MFEIEKQVRIKNGVYKGRVGIIIGSEYFYDIGRNNATIIYNIETIIGRSRIRLMGIQEKDLEIV